MSSSVSSWMDASSPPPPLLVVWTLGALAAGWLVKLLLLPRRGWAARSKTVVITGASSGIGAALARAYASQGSNLWLVARRRDKLEAMCEECRGLGAASARAVTADVAAAAGWQAIRSAVEPDAVDLLVLNAGLAMGADFAALSERGEAMPIMQRLMDVNYLGAVGVLDGCLPALKRAPGGIRVLVVSSVVGLVAPPTRTGYAASKFALKGFFDALRVELVASEPVRPVITLAYPGAVRTEINETRLVGTLGSAGDSGDSGGGAGDSGGGGGGGGSGGGSGGGAVDISMEKSMSAARCAGIMVRGHALGNRSVMYSIDGTFAGAIKTRLLQYVAFFSPAAADAVLSATMRSMSKQRQ